MWVSEIDFYAKALGDVFVSYELDAVVGGDGVEDTFERLKQVRDDLCGLIRILAVRQFPHE